MDLLLAIVAYFVPVLIIVSPLAGVPLFLSMTERDPPERRRRTASIAALTVVATLAGSALVGQHVFDFFGVSLDAFRIAGGVLLFFIALDFVNVRQTRTVTTEPEIAEGVEKQEVGMVPLAIPMLSGPGSIATVMVLSGGGKGWRDTAALLVAIALVGVATLLVLRTAARMQRHLSATTLGLVMRLQDLLLAALAVQMIVTGVTNLVVSALPRAV